MLLRTDDDARHEYIWHGPQGSILGFELRFRGRALSEWAIAIVLFVVLWRPADWVVLALGVHSVVVKIFVHVFGGWFAAGWLAARTYRQFVDKDRSVVYLARVIVGEARRVARSRGPYDPAVFAASIPGFLIANRLLGLVLRGPYRPLALAAAVLAGWFVGRRLVARFQSPERYWERHRQQRALLPVSRQATEMVNL